MSPHVCFFNNHTTGTCSTPSKLQHDMFDVAGSPRSPTAGASISNNDAFTASSTS